MAKLRGYNGGDCGRQGPLHWRRSGDGDRRSCWQRGGGERGASLLG
jgi:hypothetical protein